MIWDPLVSTMTFSLTFFWYSNASRNINQSALLKWLNVQTQAVQRSSLNTTWKFTWRLNVLGEKWAVNIVKNHSSWIRDRFVDLNIKKKTPWVSYSSVVRAFQPVFWKVMGSTPVRGTRKIFFRLSIWLETSSTLIFNNKYIVLQTKWWWLEMFPVLIKLLKLKHLCKHDSSIFSYFFQKHVRVCREFPVQCTNECGLRDIPRKKVGCSKTSLENTRSLNGQSLSQHYLGYWVRNLELLKRRCPK